MFEHWANKMINAMVKFQTTRALSHYAVYPKATTAIIFIDAQKAFLKREGVLQERFEELAIFSRQAGYKIFFSQCDSKIGGRFSTPAHNHIQNSLAANIDRQIPAGLLSANTDTVLPDRTGLSIFHETGLKLQLHSIGVEHLILVGPLITTTLDSSVRDGVQYDFHVTVLNNLLTRRNKTLDEAEFTSTLHRYAQTVVSDKEFITLAKDTVNS